jgi:simple sugar transport system ATP-binding protein
MGTVTPAEADQNKLASMMVGRDIELDVNKKPAQVGAKVLEVQDLTVADAQNHLVVKGVSFDVNAGEILGIAGVQGNGQTELIRTITGLIHPVAGKITLLGKDTTNAAPAEIIELGTAHIPEDRQKDGLVLPYPIKDNLVLNTFFKPPFAKGAMMQEEPIRENANQLVEKFDVRTPSIDTPVGSLSGGNQQKVIVAREFSRPIKFLVAAQPTRGLDVGSIEYIHHRLIEKRDDGCAVLLVSTELDEIMQLSDRIAVIFGGKIVKILPAKGTTKEEIGLLMAGVDPEAKKPISTEPPVG